MKNYYFDTGFGKKFWKKVIEDTVKGNKNVPVF